MQHSPIPIQYSRCSNTQYIAIYWLHFWRPKYPQNGHFFIHFKGSWRGNMNIVAIKCDCTVIWWLSNCAMWNNTPKTVRLLKIGVSQSQKPIFEMSQISYFGYFWVPKGTFWPYWYILAITNTVMVQVSAISNISQGHISYCPIWAMYILIPPLTAHEPASRRVQLYVNLWALPWGSCSYWLLY